MPSIDEETQKHVKKLKGTDCVICGKPPEEMEPNHKGTVPLYRINGNQDDHSVSNLVPMCGSCNIRATVQDEPPYRFYNRQRLKKNRETRNQHGEIAYTGPALSRKEALQLVRNEENELPTPVSAQQNQTEDWEFDPTTFPKYYHEAHQ